MNLVVDTQIKLELLDTHHAQALFEIASENRSHLGQWLPWLGYMQDVNFMHNFIRNSKLRIAEKQEFSFVILFNETLVGRIGVYKLDHFNKIGEIGYWLAEEYQGYGITTKACEALIKYCFNEISLNRIEIKCATQNSKSMGIPERLGFTLEGVLRSAENLNGEFVDLNLYSLIR